MRFTFQLSLGDGEVRDWFEQQPEKGAYLKKLILRDKAEQLGYGEQKAPKQRKVGDYEIMQEIRMWFWVQRTAFPNQRNPFKAN